MKNSYTSFSFRPFVFGACLMAFGITKAQAQLTVSAPTGAASTHANQLAQYLAGQGVVVTNAILAGGDTSSVGFFDGTNSNIGLGQGVLITSGKIANALGPNNQNSISHVNNGPTIPMLNSLLSGGQTTMDGVTLEFDVQVASTGLFFEYVFASEEYPEFTCSNFNDVFGFFISGPGINGNMAAFPGVQNIAYLDSGNIAVTINNINDQFCGAGNESYYVNNPMDTASTVQYDGFTIGLTAEITGLVPLETYHLTIAISDVGDRIFDSGVFLAHPSLRSCPTADCNTPASSAPAVIASVKTRFFPNPATDKAQVVVTGLPAGSGSVEVSVTDLQGRVVATEKQGATADGNATVILNTNKLDAGMYQYSVRTTQQTLSVGKFIVTH